LYRCFGLRIARKQKTPYIQTIHTLWDKFIDQYHINPAIYVLGTSSLLAAYIRMFGPKKWLAVFWRPQHDETDQSWSLPRVSSGSILSTCRTSPGRHCASIHQKQALEAAGLTRPLSESLIASCHLSRLVQSCRAADPAQSEFCAWPASAMRSESMF